MKRAMVFGGIALCGALVALGWYRYHTSHFLPRVPAGTVLAFQISPYWQIDPDQANKMFYEWPILDAVTPTSDLQASLREVLGNPETFDRGGPLKRCFDPRLAVRFGEHSQALEMAICLDCDNVRMYVGGKSIGLEVLSRDGHRKIEKLTYELFPDADAKDAAAKARSEEIDRQRLQPASAPTTR